MENNMINERGRLVDEDSQAAQKAKQMGLIYKGFGRWADPRTGKVTHKSQNGQLVPLQRGDHPDPASTKQGDWWDKDAEPVTAEPGDWAKYKGNVAAAWRDKTGKAPNLNDPPELKQAYNDFAKSFNQESPYAQQQKKLDDKRKSAVAQALKKAPEQKDKITQLGKLLAGHDWYYDYSDDHSVWRKGSQSERELKDFIKSSGIDQDAAQTLWQSFAPPEFQFPGEKKAFDPGEPPPSGDTASRDGESEEDYYDRMAQQARGQDALEKGLDPEVGDEPPAPKKQSAADMKFDDKMRKTMKIQMFTQPGKTPAEFEQGLKDFLKSRTSGARKLNPDQKQIIAKLAKSEWERNKDKPEPVGLRGAPNPDPFDVKYGRAKDPYAGITKDPEYMGLIQQYADVDQKISDILGRFKDRQPGPEEQDRARKLLKQLDLQKKQLRQKISGYEQEFKDRKQGQ